MNNLISKKIIRRNLPINESYNLIDSYYSSMDNGCSCENCNKIIANIAVIKNSDGKVFNVGLDCAETLTNLKGLQSALANFNEAKALRAKVNKAKKENKTVTFENNCLGQILVSINNFSAAWLEKEFIKKYLPDFYNAIANPEKNNYTAISKAETEFIPHIQEKAAAIEYFKMPLHFSFKHIKFVIYTGQGTKSDGTPNGSTDFNVDFFVNGKLANKTSMYMWRDLNHRINYSINEILFNQFS